MPAHSTMGSLDIEESAFHAIQSVGSLQSKSASQIVLIGTAGSSSDDESSRLSSQMSSDSLSRHDEILVCPREQRARQLREIRATRMKKRVTDEVIPLDCPLDDLPSALRCSFDDLVRREKTHAVTVYSIVLNSLTQYFQKNGGDGEGSVESQICSFLSTRFIVSAAKARNVMEDEERGMECVMVEMNSQLLLQLYCMQHAADSGKMEMDKMEIVKKLRYIYIHNCASAQRAVLEEDIIDVFGASLPLLIGNLFAEVGVDDHIPVDLEENIENITSCREKEKSLSVSSTVSPAISTPPQVHSPTVEVEVKEEKMEVDDVKEEKVEKTDKEEKQDKPSPVFLGIKPSLSSRLEAMLDEFLIDDDEPSSEGRGGSSQGTNETTTRQSQSVTQPVKRKAAPPTPTREERRPRARRVFVPETPDEKRRKEEEKEEMEGRKTRSQMKEEIKAVVKQTPLEKLRGGRKSTRGEKLAELVKTAADSPNLTGGVTSALRSRVKESEKRSTRSGTNLFNKDCLPSTSREEFLSANRDKGEKRSRARLNLSVKLGTPLRGDEKEKEKRRETKRRKTEGHISALTLDSDAISKYRKRMKETLAEGSKADDTEVFYGRMSNRVGLFDDRHEKEEAKVVYNRAGRVVYSPSCVFVAHTLLNVHNKAPLLPYKASSSSAEFKLGRLVRPASKGNRLKLKKLKERLMMTSPKKEIKKEL